MRILYLIRLTLRAVRPLTPHGGGLSLASRSSSLRVGRLFERRYLPVLSARHVGTSMGAGGSKNGGEGEGSGGKKRGSKKESKETAAIATPAQEAAGEAKESGGATTAEVEYVECTVAKASEFGENE